jgi:hypothetical protein
LVRRKPAGQFSGGQVNLYGYILSNPINQIDTSGTDILVVENGPTAGNPIGHTAVAVTGNGVFSFGNSTDPGSSLYGYLQRETPRRDTTAYLIATTPEQDAAALAALNSALGDSLGTLTNNCSSRSNAALNAAGVPPPIIPGIPPSYIPEHYPGSAGYRASRTGAQTFTFPKNSFPTDYPSALKQFEPRSP